jgi:hypothetical protein
MTFGMTLVVVNNEVDTTACQTALWFMGPLYYE